MVDADPDRRKGSLSAPRGEEARLSIDAHGFGLVHALLLAFFFLDYAVVIFGILPGLLSGPLTWQNVVYIGLPIATGMYLFITFGALRGKTTRVRIDDSGVEFSRRWMQPAFIPWASLRPPQTPPVMREVAFSKSGDGQEYWVPPNLAKAILSHPACSWSGVAPQTLSLLGLSDRSRALRERPGA